MSFAREVLRIVDRQEQPRSSREFLRILQSLDRLNRTVISEIAEIAASTLIGATGEDEDRKTTAKTKPESAEMKEIAQTIDDLTDIIRRKREIDRA